jgi:RNA polymerase sigma-70 factor (ECF subfamily)
MSGDVTQLLAQWSGGDRDALDALMPVVYGELRKIADAYLRRERSGHTLQPTALVHEAWLRLVRQDQPSFEHRTQFFALAAQVMRRILVDHARRQLRQKRGKGELPLELDDAIAAPRSAVDAVDALDLDRALTKLQQIDPDQAQLVELRFFGGLTVEETAAALGISPATVKREWALAKGWLFRELAGSRGESGPA